ncbi:MAG TPA: 50S ribosomal protein L29 [Thermoanaerobaculia bacterium]|nr:50S ribosomal protein L29 [Thermoanaerobaculia bacterium]
MKVSEVRQWSEEELRSKENELVDQLFAFRLQRVTGQIESSAKVRQTRRDLARVLTVLRERQGA